MCDTEFTIEQGKLWMLQTRVGKRTGAAALRMAVEMTQGPGKWKISREEAVQRITEEHLDQVLHPQFVALADDDELLTKGLAASPGAAVGRVYFTADDAADAADRGEKVILVRNETSPEDVHGMQVAEGILTARGGLVSHAAVVARGWGKPGRRRRRRRSRSRHGRSPSATSHGQRGRRHLDLDGTTGEVVARRGRRSRRPRRRRSSRRSSAGPTTIRRKGKLRSCGPTPTTAPTPRTPASFGAEGIGLCRTEHMFLGEDRLPVVRRMILADTPDGGGGRPRGAAEGRRRPTSWRSSRRWTACPSPCACSTRRCTSSCPSTEELEIKEATEGLTAEEERPLRGGQVVGRVQPDARHPRRAPRRASSPASTPCRCGRSWRPPPNRVEKGGKPIVEIMIPLTVTREELAVARGWVRGGHRRGHRRASKKKLDGARSAR